ncbi:type VI secretion system membrane subunit TssM [Nitrincola nitratireducens]|uniref:Type VI secretion protein IcmF n=1 Tax=Nitrincola nitratireducens TaxID=1229521 RepID=W9VK57_9GAMM|nr:type VI secretion system membrane subunit TssM [Nitrincola nitratireducens]EXJ10935.1 hypothetical protein D791_02033 [Nitrincola nitratireducens]
MKMFFGTFLSVGSLLSLVALGLISLMIWFVLPALTMGGAEPFQSMWARASMIASLFVMSFAYKLRGWIADRNRNQKLEKAVVEDPSRPESESTDPTEFKTKFEEAIHVLKKLKNPATKGHYLYNLPWYMLIGPPGAGKTTALINSGLHFPLMDRFGASVRGTAGTKSCDWWFTDQAILIDTAGRFTTQDNQVDRDKKDWNTFLSLLVKYRKRRPINGIIVAYSVGDLVSKDEADLIADAKMIKRRVYELYDTLKIKFPVYLVLTKLDLLPGFDEYFATLDTEGREQVFGTTFKLTEQDVDPVSGYLIEHRLLVERLQVKVLDVLKQESDQSKRDAAYIFPRMMASLQDRIALLIDSSFTATRFEQPIMLRGAYFTSGTQDGSMLDRVISGLSAHLGRARSADKRQGKSFFIKHLLQEVVFKEGGLAGQNRRFEKIQSALYVMTCTFMLLATVGMSALWYQSYLKNMEYLHQFDEAIVEIDQLSQSLPESDHSLERILPVLHKTRHLPFGYASLNDRGPWFKGAGLNQTGKMQNEAIALYERSLLNILLPRFMFFIENRLLHASETTYDDLTMYQILGGTVEKDDDFIRRYLRLVVSKDGQILGDSLGLHIFHLLSILPNHYAPTLNQELLEHAQRRVLQQPAASRLLDQVQHEAKRLQLRPYHLLDLVGTQGAMIFSVQGKGIQDTLIDSHFTHQAAQLFFAEQTDPLARIIAKDAQVLGYDSILEERYRADVFRQYLQQYQEAWLQTLQSIELTDTSDSQAKIRTIETLTQAGSPLTQLLSVVRKNTEFSALFVSPATLVEQGLDFNSLDELALLSQANFDVLSLEAMPVLLHLHQLVHPNEAGQFERLSQLYVQLNELSVFLKGLQGSINLERAAWMQASQHQGMSDVVTRLENEMSRLPEPISGWVAQLINSAKAQTGAQARSYIQNQWSSNVVPACRDMIEDRYPFSAHASREMTLRDLTTYFASGGIVDRYFQEFLAPYVDRSRTPWRWQKITGFESMEVNRVLRQIELSHRIQNMFFGPGGQTPSLSFELVPRDVDPSILKVTLVVDNEELSYSHGPKLGRRFTWPSANLSTQSFARLVIETHENAESLTERGEWSLFRLLDKGQITSLDSERYLLEFKTRKGVPLSFELIAGSVYNPFDANLFKSIRCH